MRKLITLPALFCIYCICLGQKKDDESIKKSVQTKIDAYLNGDAKGRANAWQHNANVSTAFISSDGYNQITSWDSVSKMMDDDLKQNPKPGNNFKTKADNFSIQSDGKVAWVEYDMQITMLNNTPQTFPYSYDKAHVYEFMVKENGEWKTSNRIVVQPQSFQPNDHAIESNLNTTGYYLLSQNKMDDAIEVFRLNVKLYPNSWNTYDSLGEAYALAGKKDQAIENYEKSVKLNPQSQTGVAALTKLKQ